MPISGIANEMGSEIFASILEPTKSCRYLEEIFVSVTSTAVDDSKATTTALTENLDALGKVYVASTTTKEFGIFPLREFVALTEWEYHRQQ